MKKNKYLIITVIILVAIAVYFTVTNTNSTLSGKVKTDFAVEDTGSVDKIYIVNKENQEVLLEKTENGIWRLNKKYIARKDAVEMILRTIHRVRIKSPVPESAFETTVKNLAVNAIKAEIYQDGELAKTYYIGGPTQNRLGTFMLLDESEKPFIVHIPGFRGYLTPRFFIKESEWRDRTIFKYPYHNIASVTVEQPGKNDKSFKIKNKGNNQYALISLRENQPVNNFDTVKAKSYLSNFKRISFDSFVLQIDSVKKDSILSEKPYFVFTVEDIHGSKNKLATYKKPGTGLYDAKGNVYEFDVDYLYAIQNDNNEEMLLIQYYVFDPLFKDIDYFIKKEN